MIREESSGALRHAFEGFAGGSLAVTQIIPDSAVCFSPCSVATLRGPYGEG